LAGLHRATPQGLDGVSFAREVLGRRQEARPFLYREFPGYGGQQAFFQGRWKMVRRGLMKATSMPAWELYDLRHDPLETKDLAPMNRSLVRRLEAMVDKEHCRSDLFPLGIVDATR
jgi:arylsulfatase